MDDHWRWADPTGQQRQVRTDELRSALASGVIAPNAPVWRSGWKQWQPAHDVPELTSSALASANGVVQNIPPPPLAMVAVQHAYESGGVPAQPAPETEEPPPPPAYVPMAVKPAPGSAPSVNPPPVAPVAPAAHGAPLPPPPDPGSAPPNAPPVTSNAPQPVPKLSSTPPPAQPQMQTLLGVPPMSVVAANAAAASASKAPPLPARAASTPPPPLVGNAGSAASKPPPPVPNKASAPAMPAVNPGARASKAPPPVPSKKPSLPPPAKPQGGVPPHPTESSAHDAARREPPPEELSASELISEADADGDVTNQLPIAQISEVTLPNLADPRAEPAHVAKPMGTMLGGVAAPAPPPSVFAGNSQPISIPPIGGAATEVLGPHASAGAGLPAPAASNLHSPGPSQLHAAPPMQTMMGGMQAIPPAPLAPSITGASAGHASQGPFPGAGVNAQSAGVGDSMFPPHHEPIPSQPPVENLPSGGINRLVGDLTSAKPKNKFVKPVAGVLVGMVGLVFLAGLISVVRSCGKSKDEKLASLSPSALPPGTDVAPTPPPSTLPTPSSTVAPSDAVRVPSPVSEGSLNAPVFDRCAPEGAVSVIAPRAQVQTGIELLPKNPGFAIAFATGPREGSAIPLDSSLQPGTVVPVRSALPVKRITPYASGSTVVAYADVDKKGDKLLGRRTVITSSAPIDIGFNEGSISWAPHGTDTFAALFTVGPDGQSVEALRGAPLTMEKGIAVTFRRGGSIWIGIATGDNVLTPKRFSSIAGLSGKVGSPAIAVTGDAVIVAWADRAGPKDPWGIRLARFSPKDAQPVVVDFVPPAGGGGVKAMSPSLAGIGAGKYVLAWSEGAPRAERIRAVNMSADNAPVGEAWFVSPDGQNAGQPQIAIGPDGKGAAAFLGERGGVFEVGVQGFTCVRGTN